MAITFVNTAVASSRTSPIAINTGHFFPNPTTLLADDVVITCAYIIGSTAASATITPPAGHTLIRSDTFTFGGFEILMNSYVYVATGSEGGQFSWGVSGAGTLPAAGPSPTKQTYNFISVAYRGVNTAAPVAIDDGATDSTQTITAPVVGYDASGMLHVFMGFAADAASGADAEIVPAPDMTSPNSYFNGSGTAPLIAMAVAYENFSGSGDTDAKTFDATVSVTWGAQSIFLQEPPVPTTSTVDVPVPGVLGGIQPDDFLVAHVLVTWAAGAYDGFSIAAPVGWTLVANGLIEYGVGGADGADALAVFYKFSDGADPATYQFSWDTFDAGSVAVGRISAYRNVDLTTPFVSSDVNVSPSADPIVIDAGGLTTLVDNTRIVCAWGAEIPIFTNAIWTIPASMTPYFREDEAAGFGRDFRVSLALAWEPIASAGVVSARQASVPAQRGEGEQMGLGHMMALNPRVVV